MQGERRTLLEIILAAWAESGHKGRLTMAFIESWREAHPAYAKWPLSTMFGNGSAVATVGKTRLERATTAWIADGNPAPGAAGFSDKKFSAFAEGYLDEHDAEFYA